MSYTFTEASSSHPVYRHFKIDKKKSKAQCQECRAVLAAPKGTTSTLMCHLKTKHGIVPERTPVIPTPRKNYFLAKEETLERVISRMCSLSGYAFLTFTKCDDTRAGLIARGYQNIPRSPTTIKDMVVRYSKNITALLTEQLKEIRTRMMLSLTLDEWTSVANRRYANVNVHFENGGCINLGLIRIKCSATAEYCAKLVHDCLGEYGLKVGKDIAGATTDAAKVMIKMGKI